MKKLWQSFFSPFKKDYIKRADEFMELAKSYKTDKQVLDQVRNFVKVTGNPVDKCGFVNMVFQFVDQNYLYTERPKRYFEVLLTWQIFVVADNFRTGEKDQDLHIIFEKVQEISKRQHNKLIHNFKTMSPADKTMRFLKKYPFVYKNEPIVK